MATLVLDINQNVTTVSGSNGYTFYLQAYVESQDVTNNKSSITVYHYAKGLNGYGYNGFNTPKSTISINGTQVKQVTVSSIPTNGTLTEICKYEGEVTHDADGTKNIVITANYNPNTSTSYVPKSNTLSGTATLPRIARASTLITQGASFTIAGTSTGFAYRVDSQARFYHKITWRIDDALPTTAYDQLLIDGQGTTYFLMPTDLLNALGNKASGTLTITAYTYTDQGEDDLIGSSVRTADIAVDLSAIKPTVTLSNITINTTPISGYAIAGYSTVKIANWSTSGGLGTTSRTTYFSVSHGTLSTSESTRASGTNITTGALPESATDYTLTISAYTVDGRGAPSETVSKTFTVKGYTKPQAGLTAYRVASASSKTEDGTGKYVYIQISGDYTQVGNNTILSTSSLTYAGSKSGTIRGLAYNDETWLTLDIDQYLTFTYTLVDRVTSSTVTTYVSTAKLPLDLYDNGQGTVGVGLGAPAKTNKIVFGLQTEGISYNDLSDKPSRATVISQADIEATSGTKSGLITGQRFTQGFNSRFSSAFSTALTSSAITSSLGYTPVNKRGDTMTRQLLTSFKSSVAMGSYGTSTTTIPALMDEVRYSSGCMGSVSVNTAYTLNGITIPTGWYNFIYTPHRSGGNSGQASGDNHLYGNLLLFGMNTSNGMYRIRYSNGISEVERFLFSGTIIARSAARTIAATKNYFYKVVLSSTLVSGHSEIFTITNGGIKVAFAGKYKVSASCYFQSGTSGSMPSVYIRTNNNADISASSSSASGMGTEKVAVSIPATTQAVPAVASPMLIDLARNDIVYLVGRSRQANGNIVCNNNMTYLQIEFIG